jgi:hypothetical protein
MNIETSKWDKRIALVKEQTYLDRIASVYFPKISMKPNRKSAVAAGKYDLRLFFFISGFSSKWQVLPHSQQSLVP